MSADIFEQLDREFVRLLGTLPKPVMPMPPERVHFIPDDRSDFTRDSEASSV